MNRTRQIQGYSITLEKIDVYDHISSYEFSGPNPDSLEPENIRILLENGNEQQAWEKYESKLSELKKSKLLDFVYYHGPISGQLSMLEVETLAKGVMAQIDGIKTPEKRLPEAYSTSDETLAAMLANAYNQGVEDTKKMNK